MKNIFQPAITWIFADLLVYPHIVDSLNLPKTSWEMIDKSTLESTYPQLLHLISESARVHPFFPLSTPEILEKNIEIGKF